MSAQFIEIQSDGVSLHKTKGFLWIRQHAADPESDSHVPFDQIGGILVQAKGVSFSKSFLLEAAARGIPLVLTDERHLPQASVVSFSGSHRTAEVLRLQASAKLPAQKSAWKEIIKTKIANQSQVLIYLKNDPILSRFPKTVRSGDTTNREGVAAKFYWTRLFDSGFRRNPDLPGVNSVLNYGYAILRSAMAKHIASAGLAPALGIHHRNSRNSFQLVDDLIEPFRPAVDLVAFRAGESGMRALSPKMKQVMVDLFFAPRFKNKAWGRSLDGALRGATQSFLEKIQRPDTVFNPCPTSLFPALFEFDRYGNWF